MRDQSVQKTSPKDFFLHLLAIIALYVSAGFFLDLLFNYVSLLLPDPLQYPYEYSSALSGIRWSVAVLVIMFPVYLGTMYYLAKEYSATPSKRDLRIRKWLIYFTLFIAALTIIGDLVTLLYNFLQGDLTLRFALKVLSVFFVAGSIFVYYFWDARRYSE